MAPWVAPLAVEGLKLVATALTAVVIYEGAKKAEKVVDKKKEETNNKKGDGDTNQNSKNNQLENKEKVDDKYLKKKGFDPHEVKADAI